MVFLCSRFLSWFQLYYPPAPFTFQWQLPAKYLKSVPLWVLSLLDLNGHSHTHIKPSSESFWEILAHPMLERAVWPENGGLCKFWPAIRWGSESTTFWVPDSPTHTLQPKHPHIYQFYILHKFINIIDFLWNITALLFGSLKASELQNTSNHQTHLEK